MHRRAHPPWVWGICGGQGGLLRKWWSRGVFWGTFLGGFQFLGGFKCASEGCCFTTGGWACELAVSCNYPSRIVVHTDTRQRKLASKTQTSCTTVSAWEKALKYNLWPRGVVEGIAVSRRVPQHCCSTRSVSTYQLRSSSMICGTTSRGRGPTASSQGTLSTRLHGWLPGWPGPSRCVTLVASARTLESLNFGEKHAKIGVCMYVLYINP